MLNSAHIQNFRLFKDFQIDDLARVNLIVGKNNVGKSSLLEALYLLVNPKSPDVLSTLLENRGEIVFQDNPREDPRFYARSKVYDISHLFFAHTLRDGSTIQLQAGETSYPYKITYKQEGRQLSLLDADPENSISDSYLLLKNGDNGGLDQDVKIPLDGDMINSRIINRRLSRSMSHKTVSNYVTTKGFDYDLLARLWDTITLTAKEDSIYKMLQIIDSSVERIAFTNRQTANSILIKRKREETPIPLGSMGDGIHRILTIAMTLANSENGVLLIDEIDTGLHYRAITNMWRVVMETAVRLNVQVFATTHSWDCVESFAEALEMQENDDVGALFRLERRENEQIAAVKYTAPDLATAAKQGIEVR